MCCTRLAENTGRKNYVKNLRLRTITFAQLRSEGTYRQSEKSVTAISPPHVLTIW